MEQSHGPYIGPREEDLLGRETGEKKYPPAVFFVKKDSFRHDMELQHTGI